MASEYLMQRYRLWYARLLQLYSKPYRERFAEEMQQTFSDLLREQVKGERGLFNFAIWIFIDTFLGIIKENLRFITMRNKNILVVTLVTVGILLVPLIAMQFSNQVNWSISDFVLMGTILFVTGLAIDLARKKMGKYRIAGILAIVFLFLWLWAELAVGLFTNWGS